MSEVMIPVLAQRKVIPTVVRLSFNAPIMLSRKAKIHSIEAAQLCWGTELGMRYTKDQMVFRGLDTFSLGFEGPTVRMRRDTVSGALTLMLVGGDRHPASAPNAGSELTVQLEFFHYSGNLLTGNFDGPSLARRLEEGAVPYRLWAGRKGRIISACPCSDDPGNQIEVAKDWLHHMRSSKPVGPAAVVTDSQEPDLTYTLEWLEG